MLVAFSISPMSSDPSGSVTEAVAAAVRAGYDGQLTAKVARIEEALDDGQ